MKKIFFLFALFLVQNRLFAQTLENGNFATTCGIASGGGIGILSPLTSACVPNWIDVSGMTYLIDFGAAGGTNTAELYSSLNLDIDENINFLGEYGPGSQAIAANYTFLNGGVYTITLFSNRQNACTEANTTLELWAANGVTEANNPPPIGSRPATPSSFEQIGVITCGPQSNNFGTITFNYTATKNNTQLLIFVDQNSPCTIQIDTSPYGATNPVYETYQVGLYAQIFNVSISLSPNSSKCNASVLLANQSSQIAPAGIFDYSAIEVGSSAAPGGTTVIAPSNKSSLLLGTFVSLLPNVQVAVNNQNFFEVIPLTDCDKCNLAAGITATPGTTVPLSEPIQMSDPIPGGVWNISGDFASINSSTGLVTSIEGGTATVTYTVGTCTATKQITVKPAVGRQDLGVKDPMQQQILIYPDPAYKEITITYPAVVSGPVEITIKDVSGKPMYTKSADNTERNNTSQTIDISTFTAGVYFVDVTIGGQRVVKNILKL